MLKIDPELLNNASLSPHRRALEQGYRWLRFEDGLEQQFQAFYVQGHVARVRMAAYVCIVLFAMFVILDLATLPAYVSIRTASIRIGLIIPSFIVVLLASYRAAWRPYLGTAVFSAALVTGLSTVAVIGSALDAGYQIPYEGILLVALFIYLIAFLSWRRALLANMVTLGAFVIMEFWLQTDSRARLYQIVFMCAANGVGAYGAYFLEHSMRTTFLVNTLLHELAALDGLTGLSNRRTLNIHLERVWRQALRDRQAVAIAMIDIDHFKRYNDRYGHARGDAALKAVADVIAAQARRPLDLTARYGGEEFAVIWHNPVPGELQAMGEALTAAVAALRIEHPDSDSGSLSVSVGVTIGLPCAGDDAAALLRMADQALYQAKHQGRNQVVVSEPVAAFV
ncbi:GGDEF domain-containing protein [Massilia violaceinigra]|uniref:diguanylate cyclase n=1 Tax=Massilia violaceinigra TaxID=2045208 RepID=A0ABY4AAP3_9BURK|nr:GGDEF domain-containing protein [Massilia violaceinigra]UOD31881.1 GGDEF domain-containing protein [Massilia violaceinigra]